MLAILVFAASVSIGHSAGLTNWDLFAKVSISLGAFTCLFWWLWVMKKLKDIAVWWIELRDNVNTAVDLLAETKQDIKELKTII